MQPLTWTPGKRRIGDLIPWEDNPRTVDQLDAERLEESLREFGQIHAIAIEPDNTILDGHQRQSVWAACAEYGPDYEVDVRIASRKLTNQERHKLTIYLHAGAVGAWDWDKIVEGSWGADLDNLKEWGLDEATLETWQNDHDELEALLASVQEEEELTEKVERLAPREMARALVSVPVDLAADVKPLLDQLEDVEGVEVIYSAN